MSWLSSYCLFCGAWAVVNGLLHDIFILKEKRKYDRDLLRLLMDGHILITCGAVQLVCWKEWSHTPIIFYSALISSMSLLIYCAMIFPFLKSIATFLINLVLAVSLFVWFFQP